MSFLLACPLCGPRDVYEFRYGGEMQPRPDAGSDPPTWADYLLRADGTSSGIERAWWFHRVGLPALVPGRRGHARRTRSIADRLADADRCLTDACQRPGRAGRRTDDAAVGFTFDGRRHAGCEGDTVASALVADGVRRAVLAASSTTDRAASCARRAAARTAWWRSTASPMSGRASRPLREGMDVRPPERLAVVAASTCCRSPTGSIGSCRSASTTRRSSGRDASGRSTRRSSAESAGLGRVDITDAPGPPSAEASPPRRRSSSSVAAPRVVLQRSRRQRPARESSSSTTARSWAATFGRAHGPSPTTRMRGSPACLAWTLPAG